MLVQQSDGLLASEAERKALPRPYQSFDCVVRLGAWEAGKHHLGEVAQALFPLVMKGAVQARVSNSLR